MVDVIVMQVSGVSAISALHANAKEADLGAK
jgi:hypothetical protein